MKMIVTMTYDTKEFFNVTVYADTVMDGIVKAIKMYPGAFWDRYQEVC